LSEKKLDGIILQERVTRVGVAMRYRAFLPATKQALTVDVYSLPFRDAERRDAFNREATRLASLDHPNIRRVAQFGVSGDVAFIAYDLVHGETLADMLARTPAIPVDQAFNLLSQVGAALGYAHARGIHHHDIKPDTIIVEGGEQIYLMSFGLGQRVFGDDVTASRENIRLRVAHNSPEVLLGDGADLRADVYSLGSVLYEMITGESPFSSEGSATAVIQRHLNALPSVPSAINPEVPPMLDRVILKAMAKAPKERYASVAAFLEDAQVAAESSGEKEEIQQPDADSIRPVRIDPEPEIQVTERDTNISGRTIAWVVGGTALFVVVALLFLALNTTTPTPGAVLVGETGTSEDVMPRLEALRNARFNLGTTGTIAYIACNRSSEYHATRARELRDLAEEYDIDLRVYDSDSDDSREVANIQAALSDDARAMIVCLLNPDTALDGLQQAYDEGTYLIMDNTELQGQIEGVFVYTSNYDMGYAVGRAAGAYAAANVSDPRAIILDFPDLETIVQRADGLEAGFLAEAPDAQVLGRYLGATQDNGAASIEELLEDDTNFNMILSINDAGAYGAIDELERARIDPEAVHIFSVDAEQIARNYIDDGYYMRGSLTIGREAGSVAMLNAAVSLLGGEDIPQNIQAEPGTLYPTELDVTDDS
jgi:ABC-type sugar transport system substrate-binding protein